MKQKLVGLALFVAAAAAPANLSHAADGDPASPPLPVVHDLGCAVQCADVIDPVPLRHFLPDYPENFTNGDYGGYVEGLVELEYMIEPDGSVGDIMVTHLVGPQKFVQVTEDAVKKWTYKPATMGGQPVDRDHKLTMKFEASNGGVGARNDIVTAYRDAVALIKDNKLDEAEAKMNAALARPLLNFYERAYIGHLLAAIALQRGDYLKARQLMEMSVYLGLSGDVNSSDLQGLLRTRLLADLGVGDVSDAMDMLAKMKSRPRFDAKDSVIPLVANLKAKIDASESFGLDARIPASDDGDAFDIGLYRSTFAIHSITGSLDKLIISCKQHTVESDITDKAQWHVPKDWSACHAIIRGAAGTSFQLVQYAG